jgi:hypothetical protein
MGIQSTTIASPGPAKLEAMIGSGQEFHGRDTVSRMSLVPFKTTCSRVTGVTAMGVRLMIPSMRWRLVLFVTTPQSLNSR